MELLFIRHGETEWNVLKKIQGQVDTNLNENGIKQAEELKDKLASENVDVILTSPLIRAKKTAEIIKGNRNIEIIVIPNLIERDFGELEGISYDEFDYDGFWSYKKNLTFEGAENIKDFFRRIYKTIDKIKQEYENKRILIVAHAGVSISLKCYFEGIPDIDTLAYLATRNCEVAKFEFKE